MFCGPNSSTSATHAFLADVDAALGNLHRRVFGEQVGEQIPLLLVEVVAVHRDELLDVVRVLQELHALLERGDRRVRRLLRARAARRDSRSGRAGCRRPARRRSSPTAGDPAEAASRRRRPGLVLVLRPAAFVRNHEGLVPVELRDLPDAVVLDVLVLVRAFAPARALAVLPAHDERAPAGLRGLAVVRDVHDGLQLDVLVQAAFGQADLAAAERVEIRAHALLADVHAVLRDLDGAVLREQVGDVVPLRLVDVVAVGTLQSLDGIRVGDAVGIGFDLRERVRRRAIQVCLATFPHTRPSKVPPTTAKRGLICMNPPASYCHA